MGHENSKSKCQERRYDNEALARKERSTLNLCDLDDEEMSVQHLDCIANSNNSSTACSAANLEAVCPASRHRSNSCPNENDVFSSKEKSPRPTKKVTNHFLSRKERAILQNCWKKTKKTGPDHIGIHIFYMILTAQPDIKDIFDLEKVAQGQLKYDARFRQQAMVYTKVFDYIMKNLEYPDKLESHFINVGRRHAGYQKRGFNPEYWDTFVECMTQAAAEWDTNRQRPSLDAWRNLVDHIIGFMRKGFDEENNKARRS